MINIRPNNLYHHFRVLVKAGIIEHHETRKGKGFIKEDYFRLKDPDRIAGITDIPSKHRQQLLFGLFQAMLDDFKTTVARYEKTVAMGTRNDLRCKESDLEEVRETILRHREELKADLNEITENSGQKNYQVSVFGYRV